jgi:hypothetical protein
VNPAKRLARGLTAMAVAILVVELQPGRLTG